MNSRTSNSQDNLKKVLRTVLVGIKPADQVMLKGYLRVLLRLEADFEWVSASHPQVDLFMIGNEFRDAASIIKLLSSQQQKPVLYVSRTDADEGWMTDDKIILPLKKLDAFNEWLMSSVAVLKQGAGAVTTILQQNNDFAPQKQAPATANHNQSLLTATLDRSNLDPASLNTPTVQMAAIQSVASISPTIASRLRMQDYQGLISLIKQLQRRPAGLHQIVINTQIVAIIKPSQARVWLSKHTDGTMLPALNLDWQLRPYQGLRPADSESYDLTQWLWQQAWGEIALLLPLVSDESTYKLRYWVKPVLIANDNRAGNITLTKKDRQELLRVMTALETAPRNVNQLASIADISVKSAKKVIASLLFSGSLQAESYANLDIRLKRKSSDTNNAAADNANPAKQTTLDALLARRARGEVSDESTTTSSINASLETQAPPQPADVQVAHSPDSPPTSAQQAKRGFLSRLRQKLGL